MLYINAILNKLELIINKAILITLFNLNKNACKCYNYNVNLIIYAYTFLVIL
jgi:hypothetical protein